MSSLVFRMSLSDFILYSKKFIIVMHVLCKCVFEGVEYMLNYKNKTTESFGLHLQRIVLKDWGGRGGVSNVLS